MALVEADRVFSPESELALVGAPLLSALRLAGIVRAGDPGMAEISPPDLGRTLRQLYGALSHGVALPSALDDRPVLLGWTGEGALRRELLLVSNPSRGLAWALRRPYRSLVLVPTARALTNAVRERHGPGAMVEVEALEEALVVCGGRLGRRRASRARRAPVLEARAATRGAGEDGDEGHGDIGAPAGPEPRAILAGAQRWNQVRICVVQSGLVRVDLPDRSQRCTPADLGMAHPRSRAPTVLWEALVTLCEDHGYFHTTRFGGPDATKKVISRLRARLRELFDLQAPPFRRYQSGTGWRARFDARPDLPSDPEGLGDTRRVRLGDKSGLSRASVDDFLRRQRST